MCLCTLYIVQKHNFLYIIHTDNKFWRWGDGHSSKYLAPPSKFLFVIECGTQTFAGCGAHQKKTMLQLQLSVAFLPVYIWLRTLACMWMWMAVLHNVPMDTTTHTHALSLLSVMEQLFQFPRVPEPNCVLWSTKIYENSFFFGVFGLIFCSVAPSVLSFSFRSRKRFPRLPKTDTLLLIGILRDWKRKRAAATAA